MSRTMLYKAGAAVISTVLLAVLVQAVVGSSEQLIVDMGSRPIEILKPQWLFAVCIVPWVFYATTFSLTDVSFAQRILGSALRCSVLLALMFALCRPTWIAREDRVATVIVVDVSESVTDTQLTASTEYVRKLFAAKHDKDTVELVTFAQTPRRIEWKSGVKATIARHKDAGAGTDIQAAVQLAYGLLPSDALPRIVILSDGNQTEGDLEAEAQRASNLGVPLSWVALPADARKEVRITGLHIPDEVKVGAPFEVTAEVWSSTAQRVRIALRQNEFPNPLAPSKTVELKPGRTRVKFKTEVKRAGFANYTVRLVDPKVDTNPRNNQMVMSTPVKGRPRILYVEGGVTRNPSVASYIKRALEHENMEVEVRGPRGLPSSAKGLRDFDLVMVSDVPAHFVGMAQMAALESYVRDLGGGFIMAGGEDSFGSGGYQNTTIEKILPVRLDGEKTREQPNIAIMLVMDRSGSMRGPKIEAAKTSARATVEVLSPNDIIGVIGFDSSPSTVVRMQRAYNRMRISSDISRLRAGGGTNIYPALLEAYHTLQTVNAKVKHVILLSDGQAPDRGIAELCREMVKARITVSAVGIGDAQRSLLKKITDNGKGRLYMTDAGSLPRIFMKETTEVKKSSLVEDRVFARVAKRVEMIEGTGVERAPALHGYVSTKAKKMSEVVLVSDLGEPLLARWRVGTGTVVAWTSDVKNRWSTEWIRWAGYPKFWAQVVRTSMRRKSYDSYDLTAMPVDGAGRVEVDALDHSDNFVNGLETTLEIIDPSTEKTIKTLPMPQVAAGRYQAEFAMGRYGSYLLKAVHKREGRTVAESMGAVSLPYPREYLSTEPRYDTLAVAAKATGGFDKPTPEAMFASRESTVEYREHLWPWLLFLALGLLVVDTYLKRVRVFGHRVLKM